MKAFRSSAVLLVLITGVVALAASSCSRSANSQQTGATTAAAPFDTLKRGEYLSVIGGCNDCHTPGTFYGAPNRTRLLAGSEVGWSGPWGTSYARNLTPDPETGLGAWTEEQIVVAIRTGQRPDGTRLLPPMPWPNLSTMPDEDAFALARYLKSIPPVKHAVPAVVPSGQKATTPAIVIPPPGAWDAPVQSGGGTSAENAPTPSGGA